MSAVLFETIKPGELFDTGSVTHDGRRNIVRVWRRATVSDGWYCTFVNPDDPTEIRQPGDREFFAWDFEIERKWTRYEFAPDDPDKAQREIQYRIERMHGFEGAKCVSVRWTDEGWDGCIDDPRDDFEYASFYLTRDGVSLDWT